MLDGIIAVLATPFTNDNRLDVDSLRRVVRSFLARGAVGFLAPAVSGEVETLSEEEREQVVGIVLEEVNGRVPVIGGATDPDASSRIRHAERFIEMGCSGVLAYVRYEGDAAYATAISALGRLNPGFLMVQDLDQGAAPLPVPLIARLHREIPCFTWIKLETGDRCRKISAVREAAGPALQIGSAGVEMIELLDRGVRAYMPTLYPDVYSRIWSLHRAGRRTEAVALYHRLLPCLSFAATHQPIRGYVNKVMLQAEGVFTTTRSRRSTPDPDPTEVRLTAELAEYALGLSAELNFGRRETA